MNRKNLSSLMLCFSLMVTGKSLAFTTQGSFSADIGPSTGVASGGSGDPSSSVDANVTRNMSPQCRIDDSKKKEHLSLSLIKALMVNPKDFKVTKVGDNLHRVTIPNIVSAGCLENRLLIDKVAVENGLGLAFKLKDNGGPDKGYEQLKKCFQKKKIMEVVSGKDVFRRDRVKSEDINTFSFDINVEAFDDKTVDIKKLYFISPDRDPAKIDYGNWVHGSVKIHSSDFKKCYRVESHQEKPYAIYKNRQISEAYAACSSDDLKRMLAAYKNLDATVTGNAAGAFELAKKALEIAMQDQLDENKKKIFDKLREYKRDELRRAIKDMNRNKLEEDEAADVVKGYAAILNELNEKVIDPAIIEIKALLKERKTASEDRRDEIRKRIKVLNRIIGEFARSKTKYGADLAKKLVKKFALIREGGTDLFGFVLKSENWGKVGKGSRQISEERAKKNITKGMKNFERMAEKWEKDYEDYSDARSGDMGPAREMGRRAARYRQSKQRAYQSYMKQEQKYRSYCQQGFFGVKNPVRCQRGMNPQAVESRRRRFMKHREGLTRREAYYQVRHDHYSGMARDARRADSYGDDPFYSDYGFSDHGDPFFMDENPYGLGGYGDYSYGAPYGQQYAMNPGQGQYGMSVPYTGNAGYRAPAGAYGGGYPPPGGQYGGAPYGGGYPPPQYPMQRPY